MTLTDEILSAYLDSELPAEEMDRITDEIASDPVLALRLEEMRNSDAWLAGQFAAVDNKPIRAHTLDLISQFSREQNSKKEEGPEQSNVIALKPRDRWAAVTNSVSWGQAIAASIVLFVGIGAGMQFGGKSSTDGFATLQTAGLISPASPLYDVLETTPSLTRVGLDDDDASAAAVISFETANGIYCRELQVSTKASHSRSIACRSGDDWLIKATVASAGPAPVGTSDFIPASTAGNQLIDQTIMTLMKGDALSSVDENQLIVRNWQQN